MNTGIYVHIPFCKKKCPYCDFYSIEQTHDFQEKYAKALMQSMEIYKDKAIVADTLYFGGGTPILMQSNLLEKIINKSQEVFSIAKEITIEANPCMATFKKLKELHNMGINRISFGMQSGVDKELKALGRKHNEKQVEQAVLDAKRAGFKNISVDIMLGIPHQTMSSLKQTLHTIKGYEINHVSAYMLKIEKGTAFDDEGVISTLPDEDAVSDLYLLACDELESMGLKQYEISNFSQIEFESKHNLKYWLGEDYIGFGPSAHSYHAGKRFYYDRDIEDFIKCCGKNMIFEEQEEVDKLEDYIIFNLRLTRGISLNYLEKEFNVATKDFEMKLKDYIKAEYLVIEKEKLRLTKKGFLVSNFIILKILEICKKN